jgi:thiazole/oxazole-forming peptide maturase SagD family component
VEVDLSTPLAVAETTSLLVRLTAADADAGLEPPGARHLDMASVRPHLDQAGLLTEIDDAPTELAGEALHRALALPAQPSVLWTAEEALVLAGDIDPDLAARARWAFVAGMASDLRIELYGIAARKTGALIVGDRPPSSAAGFLEEAARSVPRAIARTVRFDDESVNDVPLNEVLSARTAPGRLQVVPRPPWIHAGADGSWLASVRYACADPRFARSERIAGAVDRRRDRAAFLARAEAVERFGASSLAGHELTRARASQLDVPPIDPRLVGAFSEAQYRSHPDLRPYDEKDSLLWVVGTTTDGHDRSVPAEFVFSPFADEAWQSTIIGATTSGVAAHRTREQATVRAVLELVERDAFMYAWMQQLSRETIPVASMPDGLRRRFAALAGRGLEPHAVNLTLDSAPVVLVALAGARPLALGLGCRADRAGALRAAVDEAVSALAIAPLALSTAADVKAPLDHLRFYASDERIDRVSFLWSGREQIELAGLPDAPDPVGTVAKLFGAPIIVSLLPYARGEIRVVRALVPGLIPITFGFGREPRGLSRPNAPILTVTGTLAGAHKGRNDPPLDVPHPFG